MWAGLDHFCAHCLVQVCHHLVQVGMAWSLWRQAGSVQFGADLVQFGATVGRSLAVARLGRILEISQTQLHQRDARNIPSPPNNETPVRACFYVCSPLPGCNNLRRKSRNTSATVAPSHYRHGSQRDYLHHLLEQRWRRDCIRTYIQHPVVRQSIFREFVPVAAGCQTTRKNRNAHPPHLPLLHFGLMAIISLQPL